MSCRLWQAIRTFGENGSWFVLKGKNVAERFARSDSIRVSFRGHAGFIVCVNVDESSHPTGRMQSNEFRGKQWKVNRIEAAPPADDSVNNANATHSNDHIHIVHRWKQNLNESKKQTDTTEEWRKRIERRKNRTNMLQITSLWLLGWCVIVISKWQFRWTNIRSTSSGCGAPKITWDFSQDFNFRFSLNFVFSKWEKHKSVELIWRGPSSDQIA